MINKIKSCGTKQIVLSCSKINRCVVRCCGSLIHLIRTKCNKRTARNGTCIRITCITFRCTIQCTGNPFSRISRRSAGHAQLKHSLLPIHLLHPTRRWLHYLFLRHGGMTSCAPTVSVCLLSLALLQVTLRCASLLLDVVRGHMQPWPAPSGVRLSVTDGALRGGVLPYAAVAICISR